MEVYVDSPAVVDLTTTFTNVEPTAEARVGSANPVDLDVIVHPDNTTQPPSRWAADIPAYLAHEPGQIKVRWVWKFNNVDYEKVYLIDVVVPLVSVEDAREELDIPNNISDAQILRTERRVRHIIENATGQVFAAVRKSLIATQLSDGSVRLPQRLLSVTSVGGVANTAYYTLGGNGWFLNIINPLKRDNFRATGGEVPIVDPFAKWRAPKNQSIAVNGVWGYEAVPSDIREATLILIEQSLCPESLYAERYIKTMTAADMRFEFDPGAYRGTGNVIVDKILARYVPSQMAVI